MRMIINLENAENIIKAIKRRLEKDKKALCPCKPNSTSDNDICPCLESTENHKCCCGLFDWI